MFRFKRVDESEIKAIQLIANATWKSTYQLILSQEQIDYMFNLIYTKEAIEQQFKEGHWFFFIYNDLELAGFASIKNTEANVWKLHKIYVMPQQQGIGAGKALLQFIINKVKSLGGTKLVLNVNRNNKARFFYERNGFVIKEKADIDIGNGFFMNDYVMVLNIGDADT